jgi:hypothetical protein
LREKDLKPARNQLAIRIRRRARRARSGKITQLVIDIVPRKSDVSAEIVDITKSEQEGNASLLLRSLIHSLVGWIWWQSLLV